MNPTKILLLDFNPAEGLSNSLRMILESSLRQGIELRQERARAAVRRRAPRNWPVWFRASDRR